MDRLTRQEIEDERDAAQTLLDESPTAPSFVLDRLRFKIQLCDLALQSLSQEAVRDEALEEAHKEYGDVYTTMSTKLEQYESLLKRWLIRFGSAGGHSILYDETKSALKREPNAAGGASDG